MAEHLAFGSLLSEGFPVRLSGQDSERGTFSQRHSVLIDQETERRYTPLRHISPDQANSKSSTRCCRKRRSSVSNTAIRLPNRTALTLWEGAIRRLRQRRAGRLRPVPVVRRAQVAAHVGPRLSACRMATKARGRNTRQRAWSASCSLCAEDNWQVANCTTPANYFHILRRQLHRKFRKPLILMTPKSLLRHKRVVSTLEELGRAKRSTASCGMTPIISSQLTSDCHRAEAGQPDQAHRDVHRQGLLRPLEERESAGSTTSTSCVSSSSIRSRPGR
jgi:2-oxoglutarate dehydrogenase E1 component